jgi:hypothetical protein
MSEQYAASNPVYPVHPAPGIFYRISESKATLQLLERLDNPVPGEVALRMSL